MIKVRALNAASRPVSEARWSEFILNLCRNQTSLRAVLAFKRSDKKKKKNTISLHIDHCCHPSVACVTGLEAEEEMLHGRFIAIHRAL